MLRGGVVRAEGVVQVSVESACVVLLVREVCSCVGVV